MRPGRFSGADRKKEGRRHVLQQGFDNLSGAVVPNVEVSTDPSRVFTASFDGDKEIWSSERPSKY